MVNKIIPFASIFVFLYCHHMSVIVYTAAFETNESRREAIMITELTPEWRRVLRELGAANAKPDPPTLKWMHAMDTSGYLRTADARVAAMKLRGQLAGEAHGRRRWG